MKKNPGFSITHASGFRITFDNGYTISVQFGIGNYCEHYPQLLNPSGDIVDRMSQPRKAEIWSSKDAEIAVLDPNDSFINLSEIGLDQEDPVKGYVESEQVADYIELVRNLPLKSIDLCQNL